MADLVKGAKLTSIELAVEGDARCPLCGASTSSVEIPILVQSSIPDPPGQVRVFLSAGTPVLKACGHELPVRSRVVATIHDGEPEPTQTEGM